MKKRQYYSARTGKTVDKIKLELPVLINTFEEIYTILNKEHYFQEAFGYYCVDDGDVPGILGRDVERQIMLHIQKVNLWPLREKGSEYSEDDLFDIIEFFYDCVSKPLKGRYHNYYNCGWHYSTFDKEIGQQEYRERVNDILQYYENGYELSQEGEILTLSDDGMSDLVDAQLPHYDPENVEQRVKDATLKFRRYRSSDDDRRDAIRDLADVLEYLRPKIKEVLQSKDENDLFNIINNFGIRHHNDRQKTDYDKSIWHKWMFYFYLATIHAVVDLVTKAKDEDDYIPF